MVSSVVETIEIVVITTIILMIVFTKLFNDEDIEIEDKRK